MADRFDWHSDLITPETPVTKCYKMTQNVRRFMISQCGPAFKFDRDFMAWVNNGAAQTMADLVAEWKRRMGF